MASNIILPNHSVTFTVAASDKIATYSGSAYTIVETLGFPHRPDAQIDVFEGSGSNTTSAFSAATSVTIAAGDDKVFYQTGTGPVIAELGNRTGRSVTATALNSTGALTSAMILGGIVTTTSGAAVTATVPTGSALEAVIDGDIGDYWDWSVINTGGNTFTVTAATDHTLVGVGAAVVTHTSSQFRTVKTAAATYVTYCLASAAS